MTSLINEITQQISLYKNIPKELCEYIINAEKNDVFYDSLVEPGRRELVLKDIDKKFEQLPIILQNEPGKILKGLDFNPKDIAKGRIDAFFAEIRTVFFLHEEGFTNIKLLKASSKKRADLYAEFKKYKFIVEVFCSIHGTYRWPGHISKRHDLIEYFISRATDKKVQMDTASIDFNCNKKLLIMVLDSEYTVALHNRNEFSQILNNIIEQLNWGNQYYFGLITGKVTLGCGKDDVIVPMLKN